MRRFFSAEDADSLLAHGKSEHSEGAFYIWTKSEIIEALGVENAAIFCVHYGVEEEGNAPSGSDPQGEFSGKNILIERQKTETTAKILQLSTESVEASLKRGREILRAIRESRPRPHLDDKILTGWNGLMISAFARAAPRFPSQPIRNAARRAAQFARETLVASQGGRLLRSWREEPSSIPGFAEDYAFLIQALMDLYEACFEIDWLQWAVSLQALQDELFWDHKNNSGYFNTVEIDPLLPVRMMETYDGAEPSANSISALNLLRLARMLHAESYEIRAVRIIKAQGEMLNRSPGVAPQLLVALDMALTPPSQAVIAAQLKSDDVHLWIANVRRCFRPHTALLLADGAEGQEYLSRKSVAFSELKPIAGQTALYLCRNFTCEEPILDYESSF